MSPLLTGSKQYGQSDATIARFWDLIVIPTLNDPSKRVSASQAIMVFQEGFFRDAHGADVGISKVGLSTLVMKEAQQYIEAARGTVMLGKSLERLEGSLEGIDCARLLQPAAHRRRRLRSRGAAAPPAQTAARWPRQARVFRPRLTPRHVAHREPASLVRPARRRISANFIALLDNEAQYVFDKSHLSTNGAGQRLCLSSARRTSTSIRQTTISCRSW